LSAGPQPADFQATDGGSGSPEQNERLSAAAVEALHAEYARDLEAFLWGVLRNRELAAEALQNTFQKVLEAGHTARDESVKGWLFKVAYHEGMLLKRKAATQQRVLQKMGPPAAAEDGAPAADLVRTEDIARLRAALNELPAEQRDVVERRIYREQTFAVIAAELKLPLGTVLTRMRLATEKLQRRLRSPE
jgi:RNA polymerase sigma-70 factor (ECF subfamily)